MKHYWKRRQLIHSVMGITSGILTIAATVIILEHMGYKFYLDHWHNCLGIIFVILCSFLIMGGITSLLLRKVVNMDWNT